MTPLLMHLTELDAMIDHRGFTVTILLISAMLLGVLGWLVMVLHRRWQLEQQVRRREARLRALLRAMPDAVIACDAHGRIQQLNRRAQIILESSDDQLLGQPLKEALSLLDYHTDQPLAPHPIETMSTSGDSTWAAGQAILVIHTGRRCHVSHRTTLMYDDDQNLLGSVTVLRDETDTMEAARRLEESERRYRRLFENAQAGFFRTRVSDGLILKVNRHLARMLGFESPQDMEGRRATLFYIDISAREPLVRDLREHGYHQGTQMQVRHVTGRSIWVEMSAWLSAEPDVMEGVLIDITPLKDSEARLRKLNDELEARVRQRTVDLEATNRELEAFAYSVSHDLRAPLRAIDGFGAMLEELAGEQLSDRARECIDRIRAATTRMADLINDLLALSRVTRGPMNREPVDMAELVQEVEAELREQFPGRPVTLTLAELPTVQADRRMLKLALRNILENAWKFTAKVDQPRVEVGATASTREQGHEAQQTFFVRDNGAGFDPQYADNLFAPFQRLHSQTEFEGNGIGLATVQRIIHRHGGHVRAEAQPDAGATISFTLPQ